MTNNADTATLTCSDDQEIPQAVKVNNSMDLLKNSAPLGPLEKDRYQEEVQRYQEEVQKKKKNKTSRSKKAKYEITMASEWVWGEFVKDEDVGSTSSVPSLRVTCINVVCYGSPFQITRA